MLAAIDRRLGRRFVDEVRVDARVTAHAEAPRFRLALQISAQGRGQVRTLTSQRCAALVDATALLVATAATRREAKGSGAAPPADPQIDEGEVEMGETTAVSPAEPTTEASPVDAAEPLRRESVQSSRETPPTPDPPPAATPGLDGEVEMRVPGPAPADDSGQSATTSGRMRRRPGGLMRIQGGPELGAVPGVTAAVALVGGLLWRRARLEFRGMFLAPRRTDRPEGSLRAFGAMGAVLGCGRPGTKRVEIPLCGGLELGGVRGVAQDVAGARGMTGLWLAVVASAGVAVVVHPRVRLGVALEGVAGIFVPGFVVVAPGSRVSLFDSSLISGRLLVGVELRFRDPR
ncbi:hypothetical protein OV090_30810 [Nannocystis sp. RBIL2]|uniref:hypothetical protein n=1 Tax=Nannocystis sp. RBIL2 TaxID=2996788 RepID=UPI00226DAD39|nr:hypothetical protein [Nannocystis sp. RBIL2]MCY1069172.1 hypothetical protein [Nannocystis sp. RBIL2]